jgi:hypothetical protein
MLKALRRTMATLIAVASCWAGTSWAVPVTWTDMVGPLDRLITPDNPYEYQHTILKSGYAPGTDTIYTASMYIWLYDDAIFGDIPWIGDAEETVGFRLDNGVWQAYDVDSYFYSLDNFDFTVTSLVTDGLLNVKIKSYRGDFGFAGSLLLANGESTAVPEPSTLALFGFGLLGVGLATRLGRRRSTPKP